MMSGFYDNFDSNTNYINSFQARILMNFFLNKNISYNYNSKGGGIAGKTQFIHCPKKDDFETIETYCKSIGFKFDRNYLHEIIFYINE